MSNPGNALYLYALILVTSFLLSPRWGRVRDAITDAANQKNKATTSGSTTPAAV